MIKDSSKTFRKRKPEITGPNGKKEALFSLDIPSWLKCRRFLTVCTAVSRVGGGGMSAKMLRE